MLSSSISLILPLATFVASLLLCYVTRICLIYYGIVDIPNARSSHTAAVPRGGGIAIVIVILIGWLCLRLSGQYDIPYEIFAGILAVAIVSVGDDISHVSALARLAAQTIAVVLGVAFLPVDGPVLAEGLPLPLDRLLVGLMWLWFVNVFNFMDGIDGLAAIGAVAITIGLVAIAVLSDHWDWPVAPALVVAAAVAGFLPFNFAPARMFMGDVGSATLGYVLGWLLILVAADGALITAVLLALYFVADATSTLIYRMLRRRPIFEPHRLHAYQRAVDRGLSHMAVAIFAGAFGIVLALLGWLALALPVLAIIIGIALTGAFIALLRGQMQRV